MEDSDGKDYHRLITCDNLRNDFLHQLTVCLCHFFRGKIVTTSIPFHFILFFWFVYIHTDKHRQNFNKLWLGVQLGVRYLGLFMTSSRPHLCLPPLILAFNLMGEVGTIKHTHQKVKLDKFISHTNIRLTRDGGTWAPGFF